GRGASLPPAAVGRQSPFRLRSIRNMPPRLPRANALKLPAMSGHGEWNESRKQEGREEDCQNQEAGEEGGREKSGGKEASAEARGPHEKSKQHRRAGPPEFQADWPPPTRRLRGPGARACRPAPRP